MANTTDTMSPAELLKMEDRIAAQQAAENPWDDHARWCDTQTNAGLAAYVPYYL